MHKSSSPSPFLKTKALNFCRFFQPYANVNVLTVNYDNKQCQVEYKPDCTLIELKKELATTLDIPLAKLQIYYNSVLLNGESEPCSFFFPDNSTINVLKMSDRAANPMMSMFSDEKSMESMLNMFPGLKKNMKDNKQLKEMVQSGYLQEEMQKMMNNPMYMKEQMKNADLAMSKLENMPGGMEMMNSMIQDVRDPLESMFQSKGKTYKLGENQNEINTEPIKAEKENPNYLLLYVSQLSEMRQFGFKDVKRNVDALIRHNGDVEAAMVFLIASELSRRLSFFRFTCFLLLVRFLTPIYI
jgi:ubiquilin